MRRWKFEAPRRFGDRNHEPRRLRFDGRPAYSPDGTKIAFYQNGGNDDIFSMNANGSGPIELTTTADNDLPNWQPLLPSPGTPPPPAFDTTDPVITSLKITSKFSHTSKKTQLEIAAKKKVQRSATIRYSLSEAATV